jgi:hypothetical protein
MQIYGRHALADVLGDDFLDNSVAVHYQSGHVTVVGRAGMPDAARARADRRPLAMPLFHQSFAQFLAPISKGLEKSVLGQTSKKLQSLNQLVIFALNILNKFHSFFLKCP